MRPSRKACWAMAWRLDPTGNELRSPCDGEVISVAASRHALALRAAGGAEILVHVGVDTVGLAGEGFNVHVRKGDRVHAGDLLITFDLDLLARKAPSLMTPVIVTNGGSLPDRAGEYAPEGRQRRCAVRDRTVRGRRFGRCR